MRLRSQARPLHTVLSETALSVYNMVWKGKMTDIVTRVISAQETYPLRAAVLRPGQPPEALLFHGDGAPETVHIGALDGDRIVSIGSVYHEPPPGADNPGAWRLRGMATAEDARRRGYGAAVLHACIEHVVRQGGTGLWFNARTAAVPFYQAMGFATRGEEFELPGIGPHYFMCRDLP